MTSFDIYNSLRYFDTLPQVPYSIRTNPIMANSSFSRSRRSTRRSRASRVPTFYNDDLYTNGTDQSTQHFKYLNEVLFPKHDSFLNHFVKKYIMVNETLKLHNGLIEYAKSGIYDIDPELTNQNVTIYYDNTYLNKFKKKYEHRIKDEDNETQQNYILLSFVYILSRDCIDAFNHLSADEQLTLWMRIKSQLPTLVNSPMNYKCSTLIKDKLEDVTKQRFNMTSTDTMSIYNIPNSTYKRGNSTHKMHICFNPELFSTTSLYFEAILIFHNFYTEHMQNVSFYKVIGSNVDRDSKKPNIVAFNDYNRKMADIVVYLEHIHNESEVIDYGERFRTFFMKAWKHKITPFSKSRLLFNSSTDHTLSVKDGKYFIQYTSGAAGNTKLDCISKIIHLPNVPEFNGELLSPETICKRPYKIKTGITFKKDGLKYRIDCKHSPKATKKECIKGIRNKIGRYVDSKFIEDNGTHKHICYDELCFY